MCRDNPLVQFVFVVAVTFIIGFPGLLGILAILSDMNLLGILGIAWMIVGLWLFELWTDD